MRDLDYLLTRELEGHLQTLVEALSRGVPGTYPEYCRLVGEIAGTRYAVNSLAAIRKQLGGEEDEA